MKNLFDKLPEIIEKSSSLFGFFALSVIILGMVAFLLFKNSGTKQKERIFIYVIMFCLILVSSAFFGGRYSGYQKGSEDKTVQVSNNPSSVNPSLIKLSETSIEQLENHIKSRGNIVTPESKTLVLEKALEEYTKPRPTPAPTSVIPVPITTPTSLASPQSPISTENSKDKDSQTKVADFQFFLKGCYRDEQNINCQLKVTNLGKDRRVLYLYANSSDAQSVLFDGSTRYIANEVRLADLSGKRYVRLAMLSNIGNDALFSFPEVPETIDKLRAIDLKIFVDHKYSAFTFKDVPVTNKQ